MEQAIQFISNNPYAMFVVVGFIIGLIARIVMPGPDPMGIIATGLLGITGSFVGAYGATYFDITIASSTGSYAASMVGALALLSLFKFVRNIG